MKYFITVDNAGGQFNATAKAPADVAAILQREGWKEILITKGLFKNVILYRLNCLFKAIKLLSPLSSDDEILMQFPFALNRYLAYILKLWPFKKIKITILIHDIDELRFNNIRTDYSLMKLATKVIAHTDAMKGYLITQGISEDKIKVLHFFDYLVTKQRNSNSRYGYSVTFAGNLQKSGFLKMIKDTVQLNRVKFNLYGAACPEEITNNINIHYMGKFSPEDISTIDGDWGLVWDGDDIDTCASTNGPSVGNYLRYNSSHKISLYLAAGMPIIVWEESGLAKFITEHNLGISVQSLRDIPLAIENAQHRVPVMKESIEQFSNKIRNGKMLRNVLL